MVSYLEKLLASSRFISSFLTGESTVARARHLKVSRPSNISEKVNREHESTRNYCPSYCEKAVNKYMQLYRKILVRDINMNNIA